MRTYEVQVKVDARMPAPEVRRRIEEALDPRHCPQAQVRPEVEVRERLRVDL